MLRFASLGTLALAFFTLAACSDAVIATGNGGGGTATTSGTTTTSGTAATRFDVPCDTLGEQACIGNGAATCAEVGGEPRWLILASCGPGKTCNAEGTKCVSPPSTCSADAECGCGCSCTDGACSCADLRAEPCGTDDDCGDPCSQLRCLDNHCSLPACLPGQDITCNDNPGSASPAGHCNEDATCTCDAGHTKASNGRCGG